MTDQLEIETGPKSRPRTKQHNSRAAYLAWRRTEDGARVWSSIQTIALDQHTLGRKRISTKALVEQVRSLLVPKVDINNSYTPYLADDLVARYPSMGEVIQRKTRKKVA